MELQVSILDPTGNITALVESEVETARQPAVAAEIMRRHPEVEQVGFLRPASGDGVAAELRMAGGEFCGNASMCAAVLCRLNGVQTDEAIRLRVSGTSQPVSIRLRREAPDRFLAELTMPPALGIEERAFRFEGISGVLPLVRLEGISHVIAEPASPFFSLLENRETAEGAVRSFCKELRAEGMGLLFLDGEGAERRMTPLVYIPGSGTVFWENSCASGSAAVGVCLAKRSGAPVDLCLRQPGGTLRVSCDPRSYAPRLGGSVKLIMSFSENFSESC